MLKRCFDVLLSAVLLVVFSPILATVALLVRFRLGAPIFFRQVRPGLHEQPFAMLKFRTMKNAFDANGQPLGDEFRMTRFGSMLRALSLDELPELWNVLKGDMSFVGPRPLLMDYLPLYNTEQRRRHHVKPGITGWAQINGRNHLPWEERFALDVWYVDNRSLRLDLKILYRTIHKVFIREGITGENSVTMQRFMGKQ